MALDKALIAFKKLFNKPHTTPNNPLLANEGDNVGFSSVTTQIFGQNPPLSPPTGSFYDRDASNIVEKVRLYTEFIPGTDTTDGRHGFYAKLPPDYEVSSSNPKKGTFPWINNQVLAHTTGAIQIVPEFMGSQAYKVILRDSTTAQIPLLDPREWFAYAFGGIVYQQTPPGTGDDPENPSYLDCYIYIGKMADEVIASGSASGSNIAFESQGLELTPSAVRVNFTGPGVSGSVSGGNYVTYTVSGSEFDIRQILILESQGPMEGFGTGSLFYSCSYEENKPFVSSSCWYTDISKSQKIFEKIFIRNSKHIAEQIVYKVYNEDGVTVKTTITDIVTYDGVFEQSRQRNIV